MEGPEIKAVEAVIDNGSFGKRTLRFETGRLAQQADGAVAAYLDDDSMILSTTTAGSSPKENYDFFPLTVDVEEKMYAAGRSRARSSAAKAVRAPKPSWPAASSTVRCVRCSRTPCATKCRSSKPCSPSTRMTHTTSSH